MISENDIPNADPTELIEQYKRFIFKLANKYSSILERSGAIGIEDLHQVGFMAILEAQQKYEPGEYSFINLLSFCARKAMRKAVGINPNTGKAPAQLVYLDEPIPGADNEDLTLLDTIEDPDILPFIELISADETRAETQKQVREAVARLKSDREREIVERVHFSGESKQSAADAMGIKIRSFYEYERNAREHLRRDQQLKRYVITEVPLFHVGSRRFNSTWTSAVELAVLWREEHFSQGETISYREPPERTWSDRQALAYMKRLQAKREKEKQEHRRDLLDDQTAMSRISAGDTVRAGTQTEPVAEDHDNVQTSI